MKALNPVHTFLSNHRGLRASLDQVAGYAKHFSLFNVNVFS